MIRICDKAGSAQCPDPRDCAMAKPHECQHRAGDCQLRNGRWMPVACVEAKQEAGSTEQGAEQRRGSARKETAR
jgi:hypothetical protein